MHVAFPVLTIYKRTGNQSNCFVESLIDDYINIGEYKNDNYFSISKTIETDFNEAFVFF